MPVVIPSSAFVEWLDPENRDVDRLDRLLDPTAIGDMVATPVSRHVSNARNEGPECIAPLGLMAPAGLPFDASPPDEPST